MPRPGIKQQQLDQHHQAEENIDLGRVADEVVVNAQQKDQQGEQAGQQPGAGYQLVGIVQAALSGPPQEKRRTRRQQQRYCAQWLKESEQTMAHRGGDKQDTAQPAIVGQRDQVVPGQHRLKGGKFLPRIPEIFPLGKVHLRCSL